MSPQKEKWYLIRSFTLSLHRKPCICSIHPRSSASLGPMTVVLSVGVPFLCSNFSSDSLPSFHERCECNRRGQGFNSCTRRNLLRVADRSTAGDYDEGELQPLRERETEASYAEGNTRTGLLRQRWRPTAMLIVRASLSLNHSRRRERQKLSAPIFPRPSQP